MKSVAGDRPEELLLPSDTVDWDEHWPTDWSPNGIVYVSGKTRTEQDVWLLPIDAADRTPYQVTREPGIESEPRVSPDAKWLAYTQRDRPTSRGEVFVRSLSTPGAKWLVSTAEGRWPHRRRDGRELLYVAPEGSLMSVPIESSARSLRAGTPKIVLQIVSGSPGADPRGFAVSPDGQRFILRLTDDRPSTAEIVVVTNWPALVKRR